MCIRAIILDLDLTSIIFMSKFNKIIHSLYHNEQFWKIKCQTENIIVSKHLPFETYLVNKYVKYKDDYCKFDKAETIKNRLLTYTKIEKICNNSWGIEVNLPYNLYSVDTLHFNDINQMTSKYIGKLVNLKKLAFVGCGSMKSIPKEISNLSGLEILGFHCYTGLCNLDDLGCLENLREFWFVSSSLDKVPNIIFNFKLLVDLDLGYNNIKNIPLELFDLKNLETLMFNRNDIEQLPKEIGKLTNLRLLSMGGNHIEHIPKEIGKLTKLKSLLMDYNDILDLPHEIILLKDSLTTLNLYDNKLKGTPVEIYSLVNLEYLSLFRYNDPYYDNMHKYLPKLT
jgi:Leucine-rich repeat (LRR) protein